VTDWLVQVSLHRFCFLFLVVPWLLGAAGAVLLLSCSTETGAVYQSAILIFFLIFFLHTPAFGSSDLADIQPNKSTITKQTIHLNT
jgi:thiol:disulfide interchange protein